MLRLIPFIAALVLLSACGSSPEDTAPKTPRVYFSTPSDGATVSSPLEIEMAAEGITVAAAGTFEPGTGHFHIVIDQPFVAAGSVIPADSAHVHYGDGSTSTSLELAPGEHVLRLQMADGAHVALEGLQDEIRVVVQ